jgi:REP element-mobilizing transposase RayT
MENHLHLIASATNLSREIATFKSFTARSSIDWLKANQSGYWLRQLAIHKRSHKKDQEYQMWEEGSHPQAIVNWEMFQQTLDYIHNNPVKRGYVDEPSHWRYSSYRNYVGQEGVLSIDWLETEGGIQEAEPVTGHSQTETEGGMQEAEPLTWHSQAEPGNE